VIIKKPLKVAHAIYEILINEKTDNFTINNFRDLYTAKIQVVDTDQAHKTVYRQILRLYKLGMLSKVESVRVKDHSYHKTKLFYEIGIVSKKTSEIQYPEGDLPKREVLEERLRKREYKLIECIAESDEYISLSKSLPELQDTLQINYLKSVKSSSKLIGQINAIKNIISTKSD
jgi:hypothetical protein